MSISDFLREWRASVKSAWTCNPEMRNAQVYQDETPEQSNARLEQAKQDYIDEQKRIEEVNRKFREEKAEKIRIAKYREQRIKIDAWRKQKEEEEIKQVQEKLKQAKERIKQLKLEQKTEVNQKIGQLMFWKDYLNIAFDDNILYSFDKVDLIYLKQSLLNNFELSKQEQYRLALHNVEVAIKRAS